MTKKGADLTTFGQEKKGADLIEESKCTVLLPN